MAIKKTTNSKTTIKPVLSKTSLSKLKPKAAPNVPTKPIPAVSNNDKVLSFTVVFDNGAVMYAEGIHAEKIFKFSAMCEQYCQAHGIMRYFGDPLRVYTAAEWAAFQLAKTTKTEGK
jgi:hypothetical protein